MKKSLILLTSSILLVGCGNASVSSQEQTKEYLTFTSVKMNTNLNESTSTCIFYSDNTAVFDFSPSSKYSWSDTKSGFTLTLGDDVITTSYDKTSAQHYFFVENAGVTYRFTTRDVNYRKNLPSEYKPFYEEKASYTFSGPGTTSGEKTTGTITFIDDSMKTVYYAPNGMKGIETSYLSIGSGWNFSDNVYSFNLAGEHYESSYSEGKGYSFNLFNIEYTLF